MNKTLIALAVSAALLAPVSAYAENDVMFGGGFAVIGNEFGSTSGFTFGVQMKLSDSGGIGLNYYEGESFSGTYRGYLDKYADGPFWEAGILSGGGASAGFLGGGIDIAQSENIVFRVNGGILVADFGTAFGAALTVNYVP